MVKRTDRLNWTFCRERPPLRKIIPFPGVYLCHAKTIGGQTASEPRRGREHLSQSERSGCTQPLADRMAPCGSSKTTKQIVEYTGYGLSWICIIAHRYNEGGPLALGDRRHGNPVATAILTIELQQQLREELQSPPADQGLWTGRKVAAWI